MPLRRGRLALPHAGERARAQVEPAAGGTAAAAGAPPLQDADSSAPRGRAAPRAEGRRAAGGAGGAGGGPPGGAGAGPPPQAGPWQRASGLRSRWRSWATTWWRGPSTARRASRRRTSGDRRCRPRSASGRRRPAGGWRRPGGAPSGAGSGARRARRGAVRRAGRRRGTRRAGDGELPPAEGRRGPNNAGLSADRSSLPCLSKRVEARQPPAGCFLQEAALRTRFVPHPWLEGTAAAVPASKRASPPLSGGWGLPGASRLQPRGVRSSLVVFWQVFEKKGLSDCQVLSAHPGVAAQLPGERVADQRCHLGGQHRPRRHPAR